MIVHAYSALSQRAGSPSRSGGSGQDGQARYSMRDHGGSKNEQGA